MSFLLNANDQLLLSQPFEIWNDTWQWNDLVLVDASRLVQQLAKLMVTLIQEFYKRNYQISRQQQKKKQNQQKAAKVQRHDHWAQFEEQTDII